ncbi:FKBP-type peptidyl-prolyl cis-trans isomerase N-terminal domain-containing protein [Pantoea endophytica]|uniref:FKBP-type peptidyl-prolyl cis-trans isomerase N-terminal domain-containing protein n=1 Tax=Pantoea endophytica TaxID=92488 RepID=UPI0030199B67
MFLAASKGKRFYLFALLFSTSSYAENYRWDRSDTRSNFADEKFLPAAPPEKSRNISSAESRRAISADDRQQTHQITKLKKLLALEKAQVQRLKQKLKNETTQNKVCPAPLNIFSSLPQIKGEQTLIANAIPVLRPVLTFLPLLTGSLILPHDETANSVSGGSLSLADEDKVSYASGVAIGKNISLMQSQNKMLNIPFDKKTLLAGIEDYLKQRSLLSESEVDALIARQDKDLVRASHNYAQRQQKEGDRFIKKFMQRPDTKRAAAGFYYRIEKKGEGKIMPDERVVIQVRESLSNGTVVNDMARNGSFISLPLRDYPPLFKDAISLTGKKGIITLVVPPELAWGDRGYPPSIPPGATLVYSVALLETPTSSIGD